MKKLQELTKEISELTLEIEQKYPELYRYLDENPVTIPIKSNTNVEIKNFSEYLDSLKQLLKHHVANHQL